MSADLHFQFLKPDIALKDYVYGFSFFKNLKSGNDGVIIPNGRIDLIFSTNANQQLQVSLIGLETKPKLLPEQPVTAFFAISFNPLGAEYILNQSTAAFINKGISLPNDFWDFTIADLQNFEAFCAKATGKMKSLLPAKADVRKRQLFQLIFSSNGEISVQELSEKVYWSQRQISRYFQQQFGLSLKAYCNIIRFQASLPHIKAGKLYPKLNFTDQSHFIKEIRKLSGVSPKALSKNENDRFLQFLAPMPE